MFEYQLIVHRTNELLAEAEHQRLVSEARRVNKARRDGERRTSARIGLTGRRGVRAAAH